MTTLPATVVIARSDLATTAPDLEKLGARAADFARSSKSAATLRAYKSDWADFAGWCAAAGVDALPARPEAVGIYLSDRAETLKPATLTRRVAAITAAHRLTGHAFNPRDPAVATVLAGIRRQLGTRPQAKTALLTDDLRRVVKALPSTAAGARDRAVLLVGFAGAFRRSELSALDVGDVAIGELGALITIRRSKTDQAVTGRSIGIPRGRRGTCPVAALGRWLAVSAIGEGPLFRAVDRGHPGQGLSEAIAEIVKRACLCAGLDPRRYAGHSLRRGFATSAARGGADLSFIMQVTGHCSADVARRYVAEGRAFDDPASKAVGL
jgi:integrase